MTNEEAVRWLSVIRADLTGLKRCSPKELQALDHAIAVLERDGGGNKTIDHSGDSTDMVTPFDDRIGQFLRVFQSIYKKTYDPITHTDIVILIKDMQAHIRKQQDILQELVELRQIKTTQGKTPEYLERQPKAWARAEEAVK